MNVRKPVDYGTMYRELTAILAQNLSQMEEVYAIGKAISQRSEKGAAVAAAEFLRTLVDSPADGMDFVHLRKILRKNCGQFPVHRAVIHRFSDVHSCSFPFALIVLDKLK